MGLASKVGALLIVLVLSASAGAGAGELFRGAAINDQMRQRDEKIEAAKGKFYSLNLSQDDQARTEEIERINQEYSSKPPYEHLPFLGWGAGVGAVLGVGFYGLLKIKSDGGGGDDGDIIFRTAGEYPLGAGR